MNGGNYEKIMKQTTTTRYHTTPKRILSWDDPVISTDVVGDLRGDGMLFLKFLNQFEAPATVRLSDGQWKFMYALVRLFADKLSINYCIYKNTHDVCFDVTSREVFDVNSQTLVNDDVTYETYTLDFAALAEKAKPRKGKAEPPVKQAPKPEPAPAPEQGKQRELAMVLPKPVVAELEAVEDLTQLSGASAMEVVKQYNSELRQINLKIEHLEGRKRELIAKRETLVNAI
jgi:hypothetical protein